MKSAKLHSPIEVRFMCENEIPAGVYDGLWSGYEVFFYLDDKTVKCKSDTGVRGMNIPCKVTKDELGDMIVEDINA